MQRYFEQLLGDIAIAIDNDKNTSTKKQYDLCDWARALEIEVQHLKRKYEDEWMKYYPYHLDKEYDDEEGNPYKYGWEDEEED